MNWYKKANADSSGVAMECAYCRKIWDDHRKEWIHQPKSETRHVTHVACPECYEAVVKEIGAEGI